MESFLSWQSGFKVWRGQKISKRVILEFFFIFLKKRRSHRIDFFVERKKNLNKFLFLSPFVIVVGRVSGPSFSGPWSFSGPEFCSVKGLRGLYRSVEMGQVKLFVRELMRYWIVVPRFFNARAGLGCEISKVLIEAGLTRLSRKGAESPT